MEKETNVSQETLDGAGKSPQEIISEYMRAMAMKSRAVVAKKYLGEDGKNTLYQKMARKRWRGYVPKKTPKPRVVLM